MKQANPTTDNNEFVWTDRYLLGFSEMDDTHREFVHVVQALLSCPDTDLPSALADFIRHADTHFGSEDKWMTESNFPARECHADEHAAVMKSALDVRQRVESGNITIGREFAKELMRWFPGHADYLDSALAQWMVKLRLGAKPLVFRRSIGAEGAKK